MRPTSLLPLLRPRLVRCPTARTPACLRFFQLGSERADELKGVDKYPRLRRRVHGGGDSGGRPLRISAFRTLYERLEKGDSVPTDDVVVTGRIESIRRAGSKLVFADLRSEYESLQGLLSLGSLTDGTDAARFKDLSKLLNRGDVISVRGMPQRTPAGELSVRATHLPELLAPSLLPLPERLVDEDTRIQNRHIDMLVNRSTVDTLRMRSHIVRYLRDFLDKRGFLEVHTPILAGNASGAAARPFHVMSKHLSRELALRIAPELWLKRLVVGGMDRVYELGPAFRNEGIDLTHNPEFTICEFYQAYANLDDLVAMTEDLFSGAAELARGLVETQLASLPPVAPLPAPFRRVEFIPALETALGIKLPNLEGEHAEAELETVLETSDRLTAVTLEHVRGQPLPKALDYLASKFIEPMSLEGPLFVTYHPVCMSPLSKSFVCPVTGQSVAARAELFVQGREMANMYEEENDPMAQRQKFVEQTKMAEKGDDAVVVDDSYVKALASGLPPTGGWGCGVDRLAMLFAGTKRISDVLSFGNLRNVAALAGTRE